ncbi:MAG: ATP-binding protein [Anaerolineae bacterium]|nr:ATP-binding protein [Anaerolineae bacterium]
MIIAVASGKGGTGKTTVATGLALSLAETGQPVACLDCDVEAPNAHIFLNPTFEHRETVNQLIPAVDPDLCDGCGKCADVCQFHAIVVLGGKTLVFPELCHGCGSCTLVCPQKAIREVPKAQGILEGGPAASGGRTAAGIDFAQGLLNVGEPMAVPVISQLKKWRGLSDTDIVILDAPPGASCPVVESMRGADFALLVTEPTPFGLHDLRLAVELAREIDIPAGVIVNRDGIGDAGVDDYCREAGVPILMRIPMDRQIAEALARGESLVDAFPEYRDQFRDLHDRIVEQIVRQRVGS